MNDSQDKLIEKQTITFTLLHGTFARGADWVVDDKDSESFRNRLRSELPDYNLKFDVVDWGYEGINRIRDNTIERRIHGSEQLESYLLDSEESTSTNRRFIISHSHAGNVALYALQNPEARKKVAGLVCMATPFLKSTRAPFNKSLLVFSLLILGIFALDSQSVWLTIYFLLYFLVVLNIQLSGNHAETKESNEKIENHLRKLSLVGDEGPLGNPGQPSFLIIRPWLDEVWVVLGISGLAGRLFRRLWQITNGVGGWLLTAFIAVGFIPIAIEKLNDLLGFNISIAWLQTLRMDFDRVILTPMLLAVSGILMLMVFMRWMYAFDAVKWIATFDTISEIEPWKNAEKEIIKFFGIGHTGIKKQSPLLIAEWVKRSEQEKNTIIVVELTKNSKSDVM